MKTEDLLILAAAGIAAYLIVKLAGAQTINGKAPANTLAPPLSAANPYGMANYFPSVPFNFDTVIPMQPGGGY